MIAALLFPFRAAGHWFNHNKLWILPTVAIILGLVVVTGLGSIVNRQHDSNLENCERSNSSRVASVEEKQADIRLTLRPQLKLWRAVVQEGIDPSTPPKVRRRFFAFLHSLRRGIGHKRRAIRELIDAQSAVAVEPGSPEVDCDKAYP